MLETGKPRGYDQIAPGRDVARPSQPGQGSQPAAPPQGAVAPPNLPPDPGLTRWRNGTVGNHPLQSAIQSNPQQYAPGNDAMMAQQPQQQPSPVQQAIHPPGNYQNVQDFVSQWAHQPGANPSGLKDPNYWETTMNQHGGLTPENEGYFSKRMMTPEGAPAGGGMNPAILSAIMGGGQQNAQQQNQQSQQGLMQFLRSIGVNV